MVPDKHSRDIEVIEPKLPTTGSDIFLPKVTVIIPIRNSQQPTLVLDSLQNSNFDFQRLQIIVVEGKALSWQRNKAVEQAQGEFVYFLDDDSYLEKNSIVEGLACFSSPDIAVVGGPAITHAQATLFENCSGLVMSTILGTFTTRPRNTPSGKVRPVSGDELIGCNLMIRKSDYALVGGMDLRFHTGEDIELVRRLKEHGKSLYYNPKMIVSRTRTKTLSEFIRKFVSYGQGRSLIVLGTKMHTGDWVYFIPTIFLVYLLLLAYSPSFVHSVPLLLYTLLVMVSCLGIAIVQRSAFLGICCLPMFFVLHLSYGAGVFLGTIKHLFGSKKILKPNVSVTELYLATQPKTAMETEKY